MEEGRVTAGAGGDSSSAARMTSSFVKVGDRTRFTVELRPGETTIVSWKKLMKDVAKADGASSSTAGGGAATGTATVTATAVPEPPTNAHPSLESRLAPGQPSANELNDAPAPNRFSAVIEKIERLYMGKDSSDEDLDDIPDDDQYDTEDSFIDDAELDEYFEVDKSKTKHDGYFVNRGNLEKINEPLESANQQPKKRRRKEMAKAPGDNNHGLNSNEHMKVSKSEMKFQGQTYASGTHPQKIASESKLSMDPSLSLRTSNGDVSSSLADNNDKQKTGTLPGKSPSVKLKEKDKSGMRERIDLNLPDSKQTIQSVKTSLVHKKEGSSVKPKVNLLDKAVRELEKMVAELRPPAADVQDGDNSSQYIKRRLPREIKQKLAKVARLAHASNGKVSKELLNRLMAILGHLVQIRTLKRHLKIMMNMSLSAKKEKDDKFQQIKKEVVEMIKTRVPSLMSKAAEQQSGGSGDHQESGHSDKVLKGQLYMDAILEDKICDLYDIFVDGLDEDAAPQVRKLYAELAELWPKGVMDNHGIKRAICRAKERKRNLNEKNKDQEKIKRKKVVATKTEDNVRLESSSTAQLQYTDMRLATDPSIGVVTQPNKFVSDTTTFSATNTTINLAPPVSIPSGNVPSFERSKQEKVQGIQHTSLTDVRVLDGMVVKKKVKRRTESPVSSNHGDDRQKQHKHGVLPLQSAPQRSSSEEFRFEPLT